MDAASLRATALRLLTSYGQPATLTRYVETVDVAKGTVSHAVGTTQTVQAALMPASKGTVEAFDNRAADGGLERRDLRFALVSAASISPARGDTLAIAGVTWTLLGATEVGLQGTTIIWRCGLARAA